MKDIKNIILDFGGLIYRINENLTTKKFSKLSKYPDLFLKEIKNFNKNHIFLNYQKGLISSQEFRNKCKNKFHLPISDFEFDDAWNKTLIGLQPLAKQFIKQIKTKYKIILLSNTNEIHYNHFIKECQSVFNEFDYLFFSHLIHLSKPDINIYEYVLRKMNFKPEETLFIDDSQENLFSPNKLGLKTILIEKNNFNILLNLFHIQF